MEIAKEASGTEVSTFANGENWPDSLTGGVWTAKNDAPLLLTRQDRLPEPVREHVAANPTPENYIFGGTAAVSADVEAELRELLGL